MKKKLNQISLSMNKLDKKKMENMKGGYGNGSGCGDFSCSSGSSAAVVLASFRAWRAADRYDCAGLVMV